MSVSSLPAVRGQAETRDHRVSSILDSPVSGGSKQHIKQYYEASGLDYGYWSPSFNMHFGYYRRGMSPFRLEPMLAAMNRQVLKHLGRNDGRVLDLGCGAGATAGQLARENASLDITGVSLVGEQIQRARAACREMARPPHFVEADFTDLPFPQASFDGAWNLESACHAPGRDKRALVEEVYRVLKPGASWVVVDGFLKAEPERRLTRRLVHQVHEYWALETFADRDAFIGALRDAGFVDIEVEDWSWRVAPSAAFIPWVTASFFAAECRKGGVGKLGRHRLANALAPMLGLALGLTRSLFGYYAIRAKKPR